MIIKNKIKITQTENNKKILIKLLKNKKEIDFKIYLKLVALSSKYA